MSYYRPGMTYDEGLMTDVLPVGKESAVTSPELQKMFPGYDDHAIRMLIRALTVEHHVPIASFPGGFYIVENSEERDEYVRNLEARVQGIRERLRHFRIACEENPIADNQLGMF